ncbi:TldD/PmbA family protein [Kiloniella laminariae]|uniref:TldD/PmbA family protein n=1 Tax=Kiloniella laminariae TaxID=454162 RepID=A0ABT4LP74_9PROT|nr:TldD/PmbA family protein [Kiloniella laminariae]MCZ4281757.1 TldD/PmbA family protein [Kiloniella laminariae]
MSAPNESLNLLEDLLKKAKSSGADSADAVMFRSVSVSHAQRMGKMEKLEREESKDLGLRVFIGKRNAVVSSTDTSSEALDQLVERVVAMARAVPEDPYSGIADPKDIARTIPELDIYDPVEPTAEELIARARDCEEAALSIEGVSNSGGAEASWGEASIAMVASNGFAGAYNSSGHSLSVSVLAGEKAGMERDYDFSSAVYGNDLMSAQEIGLSAGNKAMRRLNPRKPKTTNNISVVFDPRVSTSIMGHMIGAITGPAIARGTSFLKNSLGKQIFSRGINIVDDPHLARGLRSKPFDGEGLANRKQNIVENGELLTWLLSLSSARQLGLTSTAHASRGTSGNPGPSPTNLYMEAGKLPPEELIKDIKQGLFVTEMMGSSVNGLTGDYSRGAGGYWIENGEILYPVSEATIAGNLKDMFLNLTPANDLTFRYGSNAPTVRIDGMTVAGN